MLQFQPALLIGGAMGLRRGRKRKRVSGPGPAADTGTVGSFTPLRRTRFAPTPLRRLTGGNERCGSRNVTWSRGWEPGPGPGGRNAEIGGRQVLPAHIWSVFSPLIHPKFRAWRPGHLYGPTI